MLAYKFNFATKGGAGYEIWLTRDDWGGLERLEGVKKILAQEGTDEQKQQAIAEMFSPHHYSLKVRNAQSSKPPV